MTAASWLPVLIPRLRPRSKVCTDQVVIQTVRVRTIADRRAEELRLAAMAAMVAVERRAHDGLLG